TNYALIDHSRSRLVDLLISKGRKEQAEALPRMIGPLLLLTAVLRTVCSLIILMAVIALMAPPNQPSTWWDVLAALAVTGLIIAILGVAIPISWARHAAEPLLAASLPLLRAGYFAFKPLLFLLHTLDSPVRRLLGVPETDEYERTLEQELRDAVHEGEKGGLVDEEQKEMIEAVVDFPSITVDQIMTPRTEIEGIAASSTLEDIKRFIATAGHSRIPVFDGDLDHIVGILYVKDLIPLLGTNGDQPFDLLRTVREAVFVPEAKTLRDLLGQFKASKVHMAIVLDEYGGTAGLVTIEDVIEEIVGEIHDEYEPPEEEPSIDQVDESTYAVHGRVRIDTLNDELKLDLPENED
ncbi:MAG: hemolysin family protein, partial [Phycisphaeraceae bacterium]